MQTAVASSRQSWQRFRVWWHETSPRLRNYLIALFLITAFLTVYFWPFLWNRVFMSLKPGEAGVLYERFLGGTNMKYVYREGFHFVMPWNKMYVYNIRLQQTPHRIIALCKNGLPVDIEVSIRTRPQISNLPLLHTVVGENYIDVVVKPEIEAHVRGVVSQFDPEELYTSEGYILSLIVQGAVGEIAERYVALDDLLIKQIILPGTVSDAIQSKLVEEQRVFEYNFRLEQAEKEAERKATEAQGILDFQTTVASGGVFKDYLRYAGIQATLELAKSNNAKVVMIGGGEGGLPIISFNMGDDKGVTGAAGAAEKPDTSAAAAGAPLPRRPAAGTTKAKTTSKASPP